jgi:ketosteroid isomerase-like protein
MSQANPELRALAEAAYAALNAGDVDAFTALTSEDVEFTSMIAEAEGTTFRGPEGVRAWWETVPATFEEVQWEMLGFQGRDGRAVMHLRIAGTLGGVPIDQTMWQAARVRDGKVRWWATFRTEREALDAVGLRE